MTVGIGPDWRLVAAASPDYLAQHPSPDHPEHLVGPQLHQPAANQIGGLYVWEFEKGGCELRVRVDGQFIFNTSYAQIDAAVAGYGIAHLPENLVERNLHRGG